MIAALVMAALAAACATPVPKPAMVPLGQTGDFGYSERDVGQDRIEVTYTGSNIRVSSSQGKDDSRVKAEQAKIHDLALWRAAQIADQRGMAAMKIENEARNTDVEITRQYVQSYPPFGYGPYYPYYWRRHGFCCGPSWFYDDPYYYQPVRRANAQSIATLTVQLLKQYDPADKTQLPVKETLTNLQSARAGAAY
ncbi:MAG TPA: hypothetical protein VGQ35_14950 [Dongiaceae bacterium]|nr:hypothetical protein [Dongiaceae bacterium]